MKKIVKKINGIKIDVRSEKCLYITIKDWTSYIYYLSFVFCYGLEV